MNKKERIMVSSISLLYLEMAKHYRKIDDYLIYRHKKDLYLKDCPNYEQIESHYFDSSVLLSNLGIILSTMSPQIERGMKELKEIIKQ